MIGGLPCGRGLIRGLLCGRGLIRGLPCGRGLIPGLRGPEGGYRWWLGIPHGGLSGGPSLLKQRSLGG